MIATEWPTLGQTLQYLRDLGFTMRHIDRPGKGGIIRAEHSEDDSWFVFRDRDLNSPARESEVLDMKVQLTNRGFVTDREYTQFWHRGLPHPGLAKSSS